jgi:transmembrane sensor
VTAAGERVVLEAGDVGRGGSDLPPATVSQEDMPSIHEWLETFATYQATPLREVAMELRERFGLRVVFADSSLADRTLTAWFPDSDLEDMVNVICRVMDVNCTHSEGILTIRR